jgi:hypothetical protein
MRYCNERSFRSQFEFLKHQFLQDGGLPLTDILSRAIPKFYARIISVELPWQV